MNRDRRAREEEIARLYNEHGAALVAFACSIVAERAIAEDVLQQVFLKLLAGKMDLPETPRPYLFKAVRNAALNQRRSAARWAEPAENEAWFEPAGHAPEASLTLQKALGDLPEEQREVVMLRIWGEMTLEEIAAIAGAPLSTIASRYRYALAKLREEMRPAEKDENAS